MLPTRKTVVELRSFAQSAACAPCSTLAMRGAYHDEELCGERELTVRDATRIVSFSVGARERPKDTHPRHRGHMQLLSGEHGLLSEAGRGFESSECKDSGCLLEVPGQSVPTFAA